jgi:hypothetical protein
MMNRKWSPRSTAAADRKRPKGDVDVVELCEEAHVLGHAGVV